MKCILRILSIIIFYSPSVCTQSDTLRFFFPMYFEDAIGNKDTVYIAGAESANEIFNPQFGEENLLGEPFDSVFEVRLGRFDELKLSRTRDISYLGKVGVVRFTADNGNFNDCDALQISDNFSFVVWSQHPPLKISWESDLFRWDGLLECMNGSILNNTFAPLILFDYEELLEEDHYDYFCLAAPEGKADFLPFNYQTGAPTDNVFGDYYLANVAGSTAPLDTMYIYNLWWAGDRNSLCEEVLPTLEPTLLSTTLQVLPNPVRDRLTVKGYSHGVMPQRYDVFSLSGQLQQTTTVVGEQTVNVSRLKPGVYILNVTLSDGSQYQLKFVRQ